MHGSGVAQRGAAQAHLHPSVDTSSSPTATIRSLLQLSQPELQVGSAGLVSRRRGAVLEE